MSEMKYPPLIDDEGNTLIFFFDIYDKETDESMDCCKEIFYNDQQCKDYAKDCLMNEYGKGYIAYIYGGEYKDKFGHVCGDSDVVEEIDADNLIMENRRWKRFKKSLFENAYSERYDCDVEFEGDGGTVTYNDITAEFTLDRDLLIGKNIDVDNVRRVHIYSRGRTTRNIEELMKRAVLDAYFATHRISESYIGNDEWEKRHYGELGDISYLLSADFFNYIRRLNDRYMDEYQYEDIKDYHKAIQNYLNERFDSLTVYPIKQFKLTSYMKKAIEKSYDCLSFAVVEKGDTMGLCFYYDNEDDDFDNEWCEPLKKSNRPMKVTDPRFIKPEYKKQLGQEVTLNGKPYKIGDIVIAYDLEFEGGYISIGQIIEWDEENGKFIEVTSNDGSATIDDWNAAVQNDDLFLMVGYFKYSKNTIPYSAATLKQLQKKLGIA